MSAAPRKTASTRSAKTKATPKKAAPSKASAKTPAKAPAPKAPKAPVAKTAAPEAADATEVCPRCGTAKFGPEERTRWEGRRTVRYSVLVCERGHTFARAVQKGA